MQLSLWNKQYDFLYDQGREALLEAGIGYGKSMVASIWLFDKVQQHPDSKWIMAARDYGQLRTAVDEEFEYYLNDIFSVRKNEHYYKTNGSPIIYEFKHNNAKIYGFGAKNYQTAFRAGNYNGAWGDEVDFWAPEAIKALRGRIRKSPELIRFTSSPNGFNHVWEDFYQNKAGNVYNAPSIENKTLSPEYIENLKRTYSPKLFEQEVMAKRLNISVGQVYDEFSREKHVKPCRELLTDRDQLFFFTDYNISNYCGTYMFFKNKTAYAIGEEHLKFEGTRVMAQKIKSKYPDRPVIVVGDSTGNNKRDVAVDQTNYTQFKLAGLLTKHVNNPPVESRIIAANSNMYHNRVVIDPSCVNLIRDLELLSYKEDGSGLDKSDLTLSHASDGFTYGLWYFLPIKANKKQISSQVR